MGLVLFGATSWYVHRQPGSTGGDVAPYLRYAVMVVSVLAIAFALVTRNQLAEIRDIVQRAPRVIRAWAVGEAAALCGGVSYYLSGDASWYLIGLLAMLVVLALVPIERNA